MCEIGEFTPISHALPAEMPNLTVLFKALSYSQNPKVHRVEQHHIIFCSVRFTRVQYYLCYGRAMNLSNARFTLADPMLQLGSDAVGGNSGRNHPTSRRHTIHIGRVACNASVGTRESYNIVRLPGWYGERVLSITTLSCVVHVRLPIGRRRRAILNMFNIAR